MKKQKNYYQILHVQPDAPAEVIRATYRTMMQRLKMHPDLGGDHENAAIVNEAYAVLMDSVAREKYDASLQTVQATVSEHVSETNDKQPACQPYIFNPNQCAFCQFEHKQGNVVEQDKLCVQCGSALFPATKHEFETDGKRLIQRIDKQWSVLFYTDPSQAKPYSGQTQDISLNGMQILTNTRLAEEQIVKISSCYLEAVARVVNLREGHGFLRKKWKVGMEFLTLRFHNAQGTFLKVDA